jgi:hypothetical protein
MASLQREVAMEMLKLEEERQHLTFLVAKGNLSEEHRAMVGKQLEAVGQECPITGRE